MTTIQTAVCEQLKDCLLILEITECSRENHGFQQLHFQNEQMIK